MARVAYTAALVLAATFAWAGVAKLRSPATTARTFRAFGLAAPDGLALAVPLLELAIAVGLVVVPGPAAVAALALLAGFTTILVRALRAGVTVGCGCFGSARTQPVSFVELVRNGLLAAGAVVAGFASGPRAPRLDAVVLVTTGTAVAALVLALAELRRTTGHVLAMDLPLEPHG